MAGYSQNDPRWAGDFLGKSTYYRMGTVNGNTAVAAGCYVTAGANVCQALGHDITPGDLNKKLTALGIINSSGDITTTDFLTHIFPDIKLVDSKDWGDSPADLSFFQDASAPNTGVILMIDDSPSDGMETHYMQAIGLNGDDVIVDDSWDAIRKGVSAYGARWNPPVKAKSIIYKAYKFRKEEDMLDESDAKASYFNGLHRDPGKGEVSDAEWKGRVGKKYADVAAAERTSAEWLTQNHYVKTWGTLQQHTVDLEKQLSDLSNNDAAAQTLKQIQDILNKQFK